MNASLLVRLCLLAVGLQVMVAIGVPIPAVTSPQSGGMVPIPAGDYIPFSKGPRDAAQAHVPAFLLDEFPVTNAEFLAFVKANPKWSRSQVSRLFADSTYLACWAGDLEPGLEAPARSPVVHVSWFAARAYARWVGKRLPSTAEWELAASVGYTRPDGKGDLQLNRDLFAWFASPAPDIQPDVTTAKANFYGVHGLHCLVWEWVDDFNTALDVGGGPGLDQNLFCAAGAADVKDTGDYAAFMRQALRSSLKANNTTSTLGFRCARSADPKTVSWPLKKPSAID